MKNWKIITSALVGFAFASMPLLAFSETRVTYKSAKSTSSYYQMAVQISEAMKKGSKGNIIVTVEESQGSVQNVKETAKRKGNYVFTTPPVLVKLAQKGIAMFKGKTDPAYNEIRALFPIPSLTMHFVMRKDSGVVDFEGLKGKTMLIGKGSFGAKEGAKYLKLFGLEGKVKLANVELNAAVGALKNKQIDLLDIIYEKQNEWTSASSIEEINENLQKLVQKLGINYLNFDNCLNNEDIESKILNDRIESQKKYSINATPTIIINEEKFKKELSFKNIKKIIDKII